MNTKKGMSPASGADCPVCAKSPTGGPQVPMQGKPQQRNSKVTMRPQQPGPLSGGVRMGPIALKPGPFTRYF